MVTGGSVLWIMSTGKTVRLVLNEAGENLDMKRKAQGLVHHALSEEEMVELALSGLNK